MLVVQQHLIRADFVVRGAVQFFVRAHFVVVEDKLLFVFDCFVDEIDVQKQIAVLSFVPVAYRVNVLDVRFEILAAQKYQLVNELLGIRRVYVAAA